jgi:adenylate cyclase
VGARLGAAVAAAVLALVALGGLDRLEADAVDARFALRGAEPRGDVVVVAVDAATFAEYERTQWPYPRRWHAEVIDRLAEAGAERIAYDVQFTEASRLADDLALFDAAGRAGGVVFATTEVAPGGRTNVLGGDDNLARADARAGNAILPAGPGGVIRRMRRSEDGLMSFAWVAAGVTAGPEDAWIDFQGPPGTVPTVSFADVREGRLDPEAVRGRVVVVGATAPTLHDLHSTPGSGGALMAGPEVQANAISTALRGFPLRSAPGWIGVLAVLGLSLAVPSAARRVAIRACGALALGLAAAWTGLAWGAFALGWVVPVAAPLTALALSTLAALAVRATLEGRARRRVRATLERFAGEQVVGELLDRGAGEAALGGVRQVSTVLFCDLRGFTAFAEEIPAERVIGVLNRYLTEMSDAILDRGGTLVSYMGDGIMAVFGSPIERPDHAEVALAAARDMAGPRLARFNAWLATEGLDVVFALGVGLNSGPVMSGMVGSERRLEYAAVGDTTNVAARLQALSKGRAESVLFSDATRELLPGDMAGLACLGHVELPGRRAGLVLWGVREPQDAVAASLAAEERSSPHAPTLAAARPVDRRPASGQRPRG